MGRFTVSNKVKRSVSLTRSSNSDSIVNVYFKKKVPGSNRKRERETLVVNETKI